MSKKNKTVRIWDRPVRLLHWSLVLLVASSWITSSSLGPWHERLGYGALVVVTLRTVWGFAGGHYARFRQFVRGQRETQHYVRAVTAGQAPRYLGHNPLGGWMVLALLGCVGLLGLTGWLATTDWLWGYAWLVVLHAALGWLLMGLIALHVSGVAFTSWQHRENLVKAMLTGDKPPPVEGDVS